jgi:mono/diheme cytochrome c family protein
LPKNSIVGLFFRGAAPRRRDNRSAGNVAFAAGVTVSNRGHECPRFRGASLAVMGLALFLSTYTLADGGADTYKKKCSACHGAKGAGDTLLGKNLKLRRLGSAEVQNKSDNELAMIISKGRNKMPRFDDKLSKDQIRDLVKYIRGLQP